MKKQVKILQELYEELSWRVLQRAMLSGEAADPEFAVIRRSYEAVISSLYTDCTSDKKLVQPYKDMLAYAQRFENFPFRKFPENIDDVEIKTGLIVTLAKLWKKYWHGQSSNWGGFLFLYLALIVGLIVFLAIMAAIDYGFFFWLSGVVPLIAFCFIGFIQLIRNDPARN